MQDQQASNDSVPGPKGPKSPTAVQKVGEESRRIGDGPNTVSESTVQNTELSEFFGPHRVPGRELSEFLSAHLCVCQSEFFAELSDFAW